MHSLEPPRGGHRRALRRRRLHPLWPAMLCFALAAVVGLTTALGLLVDGPIPSAGTTLAALADGPRPQHGNVLVEPKQSTRAGHLSATRLDEARVLLDKQAKAVLRSDRKAYLATIDPAPPSKAFAKVAARTFDNLVRMRVVAFAFDRITEDPGAVTPQRKRQLGSSAFVVEATMRFRVPGVDYRNLWTTSLRLVFVERNGQLYLAGDREGQGSSNTMPLWLVDEIAVLRGDHSLVVGAGSKDSAARLRSYVRAADRAVPRVSEVWGKDWSQYVVLVVPRTQSQMERAIGAEPNSQDQVAAVTTSVGRGDPENASHIVVNPSTFADLGSLGRLVVLTHETTHVATHATVSGMPMWLSEGFADYVGFRRAGISATSVSKHLLAQVNRTGPPAHLPDADDFDPRNTRLDQAYESAWTACGYIAERWGQDTLVRFYTAMNGVDGVAGEATVFDQVLGITPEQFLVDWRSYVDDLAARG